MGIRNRFLLAISLAGVIAASGDGALAADPADKVARVAYIGSDVAAASAQTVNAFRNRLSELGWTEGRNLVLDRYWAEGRADRFPELMQTALAGKPDVLVTMGTPGALAAKKATSTVPVIVAAMGDPVQAGLVSSLSRPGGNITALSVGYADAFAGKWLELALELIPRTKSVAVIWNWGTL
jgi:putative ABC transport system substrate-binding protein